MQDMRNKEGFTILTASETTFWWYASEHPAPVIGRDEVDLSAFLPLTESSVSTLAMCYPTINILRLKQALRSWECYDRELPDTYYYWDNLKGTWK